MEKQAETTQYENRTEKQWDKELCDSNDKNEKEETETEGRMKGSNNCKKDTNTERKTNFAPTQEREESRQKAFCDPQAADKAELALVRMVVDQKQQNQCLSENMLAMKFLLAPISASHRVPFVATSGCILYIIQPMPSVTLADASASADGKFWAISPSLDT
uniref:Uncharacterized protein n=1 Tax=Romanomermis culicivorax TaxID=13658 RepID=A0A915K3K3_ROMCU